jgi:hypothetical protein
VYIYTNNQCSPEWVNQIIKYFHYKLNCTNTELFDRIIYAFKINERKIEFERTTHSKTYDDFIKCTFLPKSTEICFIDNSYFADMNKECVYYIKPYSYYHSLSTKIIIDRFKTMFSSCVNGQYQANLRIEYVDTLLKTHFAENGRIYSLPSRYYSRELLDNMVAKKIMYHIQEFFHGWNKTRKRRTRLSRFTRKKKNH